MNDQRDQIIRESNWILQKLERGREISGAPYLIRGTTRCAKRRRYDIERRLHSCCIGLPEAMPVGFDRPVSPGLIRVALPDYETLEWRVFSFQLIDGVHLPVGEPNRPIRFAYAEQTRALVGASQSWLERNRYLVYRADDWSDLSGTADVPHRGHGIRVRYGIKEMFRRPGPRLRVRLLGVCWNHSSEPFAPRIGEAARP
ncbi:MAG: hypothetical protein WC538_00295 [Thermoanaerobaculia bacterium]|jgi:hypothetical protein